MQRNGFVSQLFPLDWFTVMHLIYTWSFSSSGRQDRIQVTAGYGRQHLSMVHHVHLPGMKTLICWKFCRVLSYWVLFVKPSTGLELFILVSGSSCGIHFTVMVRTAFLFTDKGYSFLVETGKNPPAFGFLAFLKVQSNCCIWLQAIQKCFSCCFFDLLLTEQRQCL